SVAQGGRRRRVGTMSDQIRVAVVGTGYFGRFHANHYSRNPRAKLVAVVDANEERARAVAAEFGAEPAFDYRSVIGRVDAASVAVPTTLHYEVARPLIEAGINVLIEKPITETVESATALTKLAEERNVVLQVGQIERFSSSYRALSTLIADPLYFESYRIAPWKPRGIEVDVILDLMIHDIDMIMGLVPSRVTTVDAVGTPVLGRSIDLANARITFESGCVANVTASRVSYKTERRMRVFARHQYFNCDLGEGKIFGYRLRGDPMTQGLAAIGTETHEIQKEDSLANEIDSFLDCIATGKKPLVDGRAGSEALRVASMINESIEEHLRIVRARPGFAGPGGGGQPPA
ncbi:MAG: Gfo/Idh/MocA family oxidoreductase, partial [Methyloceanibacter sp.]